MSNIKYNDNNKKLDSTRRLCKTRLSKSLERTKICLQKWWRGGQKYILVGNTGNIVLYESVQIDSGLRISIFQGRPSSSYRTCWRARGISTTQRPTGLVMSTSGRRSMPWWRTSSLTDSWRLILSINLYIYFKYNLLFNFESNAPLKSGIYVAQLTIFSINIKYNEKEKCNESENI